ncbi:MAG TPA: adenylate/guanylate cyclase domain-containing protein, partial [Burkholderiales bacterium]|nr:adenylate/guanylate cyclase domain-containing protein [Burkholderiales bacterium]
PWTIGLYLDPVEGGQRAEMLRVVWSIAAGLAVLVLAVTLAAIAGRRLVRPIETLARAAHLVREGRLDEVQPLPRSRIYELDEANRSFGEMLQGLRERDLIRDTLGQYVPEQVAQELLAGGGRLEPIEAKATVLVCDIEGFAALTDTLGAHRTIEFLNAYFEVVVAIVERYRGVVTQFQGDAILAVFNVPIPDQDHGANALRAALEIVQAADAQAFAGVQTRNRVGLATGRVVAGAVGSAGRLGVRAAQGGRHRDPRLRRSPRDLRRQRFTDVRSAGRCMIRSGRTERLRAASLRSSRATTAASETRCGSKASERVSMSGEMRTLAFSTPGIEAASSSAPRVACVRGSGPSTWKNARCCPRSKARVTTAWS